MNCRRIMVPGIITIGLLGCGWLINTRPMMALGMSGIILILLTFFSLSWFRAFSQLEQQMQEKAAAIENLRETNYRLEDMLRTRNHEINQVVEQLNREMEERRQLAEKLKVYATTDRITGLLNRDTGMTLLVNQVHMAERNRWPLTICLVAIDSIKKVYNQFGYQAGDEMIKAASQTICQSIRESDTIFRVGEDEFILIFPQCSIDERKIIADRIISRLESGAENYPNVREISFNYGLAEYRPGSQVKVMDLIKQAYQDMYKVKSSQH